MFAGRVAFPLILILSIGMFLAPGFPLFSQRMFDHINQKDGLVNSSVSAILQDDYGFMWLGTQAGLQRYDGAEMILYTNQPFSENKLSHHLVQTLFYDGGDELWVGTYGGLNRLNTATGNFTEYTHEPDHPDSLSNNVVVAAARDMDGALWVGTLDGLNRLDDEHAGTFSRFEPEVDNERSIPDATIRALFLDSRDRFWIGSIGGLSRLEYDSNDEAVFTTISDELPSEAVMAIDEDSDGNLWIGTWDGGLSRIGPDGSVEEHYTLPDNRVYKVLAASSGLIYVATWGGGVSVVDPETGEQRHHTSEDDNPYSLAHNVSYSLYEDHAGIIWVGSNGAGISRLDPMREDFRLLGPDLPESLQLPSGKVEQLLFDEPTGRLYVAVQQAGLHSFDLKSRELTAYTHDPADPESVHNSQINDMARHGDSLMVATNSGLDEFTPSAERFTQVWHEFDDAEGDDNNGEAPPIVYSLHSADDGSLWVGTYDQGILRRMPDGTVRRYSRDPDNASSLSNNLIYEIFQESSGTIWVGTNRGLNRYRPDTDDFVRYFHDADNPESISDNTIVHMLEDSNSSLWIATRSGGLSRYHRDTDSFSHITMSDGLSSNLVRAVNEFAPGVLYAATMNGMNRVDTENGEAHRLSERTGMATREFTSGTARLPDGDLVFGAYSSVLRVNDRRRMSRGEPANVQITAISVMNEPYTAQGSGHTVESLELPHTENTIGFRFATLDFAIPERNRQQYRLSGFEADWSKWDFGSEATYTNLPPGEYTFEVRGQDSDGKTSRRTAQVDIAIVPPVWQTTWFRVTATVLLIALLWGLLQWRTKWLTRRAELLEEQVADRTRELSLAIDALRQSNETKDRFFSLLSHDLRGPISGIRQLMEGVTSRAESYDPDALRNVHSALLETSHGLETMLNNLLEWSRIQTQRIALAPERVDVCELLESITEAYRGALLSKELSIHTECPSELCIRTDIHRSRMVLENLLNNAIKFSEPGGTLRLKAIRLQEQEPGGKQKKQGQASPQDRSHADYDASEHMVAIEIEDNGVGIPAEQMESLFDIDTSVRTQGTSGERGSGLGLTLCRELMDKLGGSLTIESEPGKGTTARVAFPEDVDTGE